MIHGLTHEGVGKEKREGDDTWAPHARCIVSSHTGSLSQIMIVWTSCGLISKFGDLDLRIWKLEA